MSDIKDDFLSGITEQDEPEVIEPATPEPATGDVAPATPEVVPPTTGAKADDQVPYAAMKAERDKRQDLQRRLEAMEARLLAGEQQKAESVNFYDSPEKFFDARLEKAQQAMQQRMHVALEEQARETYPDFDETIEALKEQAQSDPSIAQKVFSSANPALAAYRLGKQLKASQEAADPAAMRAALKAEIIAELKSEQDATKEAAKRAAIAAIPPDLATARNVRTDTNTQPDSLFDEIFK